MKKLLSFSFIILCSGLVFSQIKPNDSLQIDTVNKKSTTINLLNEAIIIGKKNKSMVGSGEVINKEKLTKLNQPDINKVLRTVPGVNVRDEEGFGLRPNIGLRGTPVNRSAKITLMEDGILMAPAAYADPSAYYFPTFSRMESVEIIKGSSQIKYGPYTIGGVLNMVSTQIPDSFNAFGLVSYGSFNTNQQRIVVGDSSKQLDYVFEVNRLASSGFKELDNGGNTGFERRDVMGKIRWRSDEGAKIKQSFLLKFLTMTEDGNESYLGLTYEDFKNNPIRRYAATQKDKLDLSHEHIIFTHAIIPLKNLNVTSSAYYTKTFRDWGRVNSVGGQSVTNIIRNPITQAIPYQIMTGDANGVVAFRNAARTFNTKGLQTNVKYDFTTGHLKHEIQLGARYHFDEADRTATDHNFTMTNGSMILTSAGITGNAENQIRRAYTFAGYLQYEMKYNNLTVTPGIRFEKINLTFNDFGKNDYARLGTSLQHASNDFSIFLPGIGINYALNQDMNLFAGVHKGFSPPGMPSTSSVEQASPEEAINYELGYRVQKNGLKAQLVGFWNDYKNILGSDTFSGGGLGTGNLFNGGNAIIKGIELGGEYDLITAFNKEANYKLPIGIAYTYTYAKFDSNFKNVAEDWGKDLIINPGDEIPFITPHLLTTSIGYENEKFNCTLIGRMVGETRSKPGQDDKVVPADGIAYDSVNTIDNYWVFDLSANYKFSKNLTLFTLVNNVLNNKYIVANVPQGYRPGMPFATNLGLKWEF